MLGSGSRRKNHFSTINKRKYAVLLHIKENVAMQASPSPSGHGIKLFLAAATGKVAYEAEHNHPQHNRYAG